MRLDWLFRLGAALALLAAGAVWRDADAAWGRFATIGPDTVVEAPSCAADGPGTAVCAAIGAGSTLMVARYNGSAWSGWTHLATVLTSQPSCAPVRGGQVICAARDVNQKLSAFLWSGGTWKGPITPLSDLVSAPSCAPLGSGHVLCAGRSTKGTLIASTYGGSGWAVSSWKTVPAPSGTLYSAVDCASDEAGNAVCAYLSSTATTLARRFGTVWTAAINIGGMASLPPACTGDGVAGQASCFATGTNSALYAQTFAGGAFVASNWSGYGDLGGLVSAYSCAPTGQHAHMVGIACGVRGTVDDAFYTDDYQAGAWGGFVREGGVFIAGPDCFALDATTNPGRVMCVLVNATNAAQSIVGP